MRETRSQPELQAFLKKMRVFDVLGQDNAGTWIAKTFPSLTYIRATGVYGWAPSDHYLDTHIQNHGPLGQAYPDRKYETEGDTPAFMHLAQPGLNDPEILTQGGWGGRFSAQRVPAIRGMSCMEGEDAVYDEYTMHGNTSEGANSIRRWQAGYDNDFQARMDWSTHKDFNQANHHPVAAINGDVQKRVVYMAARAGESMAINAIGSSDPDGQRLNYSWVFDEFGSTYKGSVTLINDKAQTVQVKVPKAASGQEVHIILTVIDGGEPNLMAYRRVVLQVGSVD